MWALPFAAFVCGYFMAAFIFGSSRVSVPAIVGVNAAQAVKMLSQAQLNMRFWGEKEDADLPNGTVVKQEPEPGTQLKQNRSVFVVISRRPGAKVMLSLQGMNLEQSQQTLTSAGVPYKVVFVPSVQPAGTVVAQNPPMGTSVRTSALVYVALADDQTFVFPDFRGYSLAQVTDFLTLHNLQLSSVQALAPDQPCEASMRVVEQRPLSGTLVELSKVPSIQLIIN